MGIVGYFAALFIGISLGMIGGGGSILTVPVLVYLFGINPLLSTSYSLFVVGSTSLVGAYHNFRKGLVHVKTGLLFGATSITTVFLTRKFLIPFLPASFGRIRGVTITESMVTMIVFALLMLAASIAMIRTKTPDLEESQQVPGPVKLFKLSLYGMGIGLATGLLGAGGGFLLVPTLVLLVKLPMKEAVGTSLFIIALNSLIGFTGDFGHFDIDWLFLFKITTIATGGIFIGGFFNKRVGSLKLKQGFGYFVLLMGIYIISHEMHSFIF